MRRALAQFRPGRGRVLLVAAGKAAWQMTHAAVEALSRVDGGVVVTKYGHVKGEIPGVICCEAGHPVPDENGFAATEKALELVHGLQPEDTVLFLLSGGRFYTFDKLHFHAALFQVVYCAVKKALTLHGAAAYNQNSLFTFQVFQLFQTSFSMVNISR